MARLLSPGTLAVPAPIRRHRPASVRERAVLTRRTEASPSRGLKRFAQAGIVEFRERPHRTGVPAVIARRVLLEIDRTRRPGTVVVNAGG